MQKRHPSPKKLTVTILRGGRESKTVSAPTHKERFNLIVLTAAKRRTRTRLQQQRVWFGEEEQLRERALIYRISLSKRYIAYSDVARQKGIEPPASPLGVDPIRHREVASNA